MKTRRDTEQFGVVPYPGMATVFTVLLRYPGRLRNWTDNRKFGWPTKVGIEWLENIFTSVLHENRDCAASYIRYCMDVLNKICQTDVNSIRFFICQKRKAWGLLVGHELILSDLSSAVETVEQEVFTAIF